MVHRALFGSLERFTALLIEHYKGDFQLWLSPVQIGIVPISQAHIEYCKKRAIRLKNLGLRVSVNDGEMNMRSKIKSFELDKIPYMLIVGDKEMQSGTFSVRSKSKGDLGVMDEEIFYRHLKPDLEIGKPKYIFD
jgi:threonyl-tRNA synthetase